MDEVSEALAPAGVEPVVRVLQAGAHILSLSSAQRTGGGKTCAARTQYAQREGQCQQRGGIGQGLSAASRCD